jgi:hypothetical protein
MRVGRSRGRARAAIWMAFAIVACAAMAACGGGTATASVASPSGYGALMGSLGAESPQVSSSATAPATDSPAPSAADDDDEAGDSASPAASVTPGPTGLAVTVGSGAAADRLPGEPDPNLTPGALNPAVTQATINTTICVSGWTATIRPSSSYTGRLKIEQIAEYGYSDTSTSAYEEDHLISLELGGAPTDPRNLWPEPYTISLADGRPAGAHTKDGLETRLKNQVCSGAITLAAAQAEIGIHWVHAYYGIALAPATATVAPTPVAEVVPTAAPVAPPPPPPAGTFSVRIASLPASVGHGANATLVAVTASGATCSASVTYASGTVSTAAGLQPQPVANSSGEVSWTWKVGTSTKPGTSTATVACRLGGESATATQQFQVT